jgi:peptide/nickel transport system substrate-binding protein
MTGSRKLARRHAAGAVLVAIGLLAMTACMPGPAGGPESEVSELTVSQTVDVSTLDPQRQGTMTDMSVLINLFDTLTTRDENNELAPALATEWVAVDDLTWRFTLREGVQFHNGEPFDAAAVVYSVQRILDPATRSPIGELSLVEEVRAVDEHTVDFVMAEPDPILPEKLALFGGVMVPPGYIEAEGADAFANNPVGTGPYKFVEWQRGDRVVLEANPTYWGGAPQVQRLVFRKIPNPADALAAARTGEVDIVSGLSPDAAAQLEGSSEAEVVSVPGVRTFAVSLNTEIDGPLADPRVRQALNHAVDVPALVESVLGGHAKRVATLLPEQSDAFDPSVEPYSHDPERARQLLAEAGYPDGFSTAVSAENQYTTIVQAIAGQLAEVGVQVQVNTMDAGTFETRSLEQDAGDLDPMFFYGTTPWTLAGWSSFAGYVPNSATKSRFDNAEADRLFQIVESSLDPTERQQAAAALQTLLKEQAPFIYLWQIDNIYAVNPAVEWQPGPIGLLRMQEATLQP